MDFIPAPNYASKADLPLGDLVQAIVNKPVQEQAMNLKNQDNQRQWINTALSAVTLGSNLISQSVDRAAKRQQMGLANVKMMNEQADAGRKADAFSKQQTFSNLAANPPHPTVSSSVVPTASYGQQTTVPTASYDPSTDTAAPNQDPATLFNNSPSPNQRPGVTFNPSPVPPQVTQEYARQLQAASLAANPNEWSKQMAENANPKTSSSGNDILIKPVVGADGQLHYARIDKTNNTVNIIDGVQAAGITPQDRALSRGIAADNVSARRDMVNTRKANLVQTAADVTKYPDFRRLESGQRLTKFVDQWGNSANNIQVKEAALLFTTMLQGGGTGGQIAERLIDQVTPHSVVGDAKQKLQYLTAHPESVHMGPFIEQMRSSGIRESGVAENAIRQQQARKLQLLRNSGTIPDDKFDEILATTGMSRKNIGPKGEFIRTSDVAPILPNFDPAAQSESSSSGGIDTVAAVLGLKKKVK